MDSDKIIVTAKTMCEALEKNYGVRITDQGKCRLLSYARKYSRSECLEATEIAIEHYYDPVDALFKIGGILYNRAALRKMYIEEGDSEDEVHD
jgi:hypothetical protein